MVDVVGTASAEHYSITARPNTSLSAAGRMCVLSAITLFTLLLSLGFTLLGAWPVLPFAGAELIALWYCFRHVRRHADDYESLTIDDSRIVLQKHAPGIDLHEELNGCWARVVMECMADGGCSRLALRSHGREFEFGSFLSSDERLHLGRQLTSRLGRV